MDSDQRKLALSLCDEEVHRLRDRRAECLHQARERPEDATDLVGEAGRLRERSEQVGALRETLSSFGTDPVDEDWLT